jgi:hypothetical protein
MFLERIFSDEILNCMDYPFFETADQQSKWNVIMDSSALLATRFTAKRHWQPCCRNFSVILYKSRDELMSSTTLQSVSMNEIFVSLFHLFASASDSLHKDAAAIGLKNIKMNITNKAEISIQ